MARYVWMSQRYANENANSEQEFTTDTKMFNHIMSKYQEKSNKIYNEEWLHDVYESPKTYHKNDFVRNDYVRNDNDVGAIYSVPTASSKRKKPEQFRSPNICIAKGELGGVMNCNCNRHFQLNVPDLRNNEVSTSL